MRKYFNIFELAHENFCGPSYFTKRKFIFENEKSSMGEVRKGQLRKTTANIIFFSQVQNIFVGFSKKSALTLFKINNGFK